MMIQTRSNLKPHTTQQKPHNGIVKSRTGLWTLDSGLYFIYFLYRKMRRDGGVGGGLGGCSRYRIYLFPLISTTFLFLKFFNQD